MLISDEIEFSAKKTTRDKEPLHNVKKVNPPEIYND